MAAHEGIFLTFFLSGFECSTFDWRDQGRRNLIEETRHTEHVDEDYALFRGLGIAVAREGIPWPLVERDGHYDFSALEPFIAAMNRHQILPIWDLCHYGYPDDADPFEPDFAERFAAYARAAAESSSPGCGDRTSLRRQRDHFLWLYGWRVGLGGSLPEHQGGSSGAPPFPVRGGYCGREGHSRGRS